MPLSTIDTASISGLGYGFKNRIINGAMVIDQRNAGASVTPTDTAYGLDRWSFRLSQASKFTTQQNAGSVTPPAGYTNYLGVTSSSAYSVVSTDFFTLVQYIEGYNVADLGWGTANAQTVTLSFWVRSSLTGTFGGSLNSTNNNRSYPFTYTISSANTWEQKTVTVAGDTSGTWETTNTRGMSVRFNLGAGSTYSGTANTWSGASYFAPTGATSVVGTNGATFYITGVQLEAGTVATSFDYRPYGTELALCERYYELFGSIGGRSNATTNQTLGAKFQVAKRVAPTITAAVSGSVYDYNGTAYSCGTGSSISCSGIGVSGIGWVQIASSVSGPGGGVQLTGTTDFLAASAEL